MSEKVEKKESTFGETVKVIVQALLLALVIRSFLFQPFSIPSGSMMPTLLVGDYLFVSKYAYGYSRYSFPFSPNLFSGRIWSGEPKRGDIAVFRLPSDPRVDYIKRVVGLPGDRIQMINSVLHINGEPVKRERIGTFSADGNYETKVNNAPVYRETLPNGVTYETLDAVPNSATDNTRVFQVPEGHYFMMGDNRDNSADSRLSVGYVPLENFVGRAEMIFFSIGDNTSPLEIWKWPSELRFGRLFEMTE
ncbi:signal peptidase I [Hoeflea poritis]|uniref:Signal peptidase I n=1 Tax=Hoeflea poritis TaxID=2993659 RepID=A0ABT4VQ99_9HYPH|nr:signal peptidase I [Hoeflea poritis]MDA4846890.1 signal peptidase I [Hoeflea poritis]